MNKKRWTNFVKLAQHEPGQFFRHTRRNWSFDTPQPVKQLVEPWPRLDKQTLVKLLLRVARDPAPCVKRDLDPVGRQSNEHATVVKSSPSSASRTCLTVDASKINGLSVTCSGPLTRRISNSVSLLWLAQAAHRSGSSPQKSRRNLTKGS